jgi:hypothetical protein
VTSSSCPGKNLVYWWTFDYNHVEAGVEWWGIDFLVLFDDVISDFLPFRALDCFVLYGVPS